MTDPQKKPPTPAKTQKPVSSRHDNLLVKLEHLRSLAHEVCRVYITNIERDIFEVEDLVNASRQLSLRKKKTHMSSLNETAEILNSLSLKPQKGRRSDLKKIEKAILTIKWVLSGKKI